MYKIPIMRPSLPSFEDYVRELKNIWESKYISNFAEYANKFEEEAKKYLGVKYIRVVNSADSGLIMALSVLDLPKKAEVIVPSFTFNSTVNAIRWNGLKEVFADIDEESWCLDPKDVERKITPKTRVIMATHVFGNPCQIDKLEELAAKYNLDLIFDAAHGYGSIYKGKKVGNGGKIEVFSFSGTKLVTSAEGGLITTNDEKLYEKLSLARNYGFASDYNSLRPGLNGKISEMNAMLGLLNIKDIEESVKIRQKIAKRYIEGLKGIGDIEFQKIDGKDRSTYKDFAILTEKRDDLAMHLENSGIQTKKYFRPIHLMDFYKCGKKLEKTEKISKKCLCLPIYNEINKEDQEYVIEKIITFYKN